MKNLIRSNSCGSEIFISTIHRSDCLPISLQKSSSSKSGIAKLKGEIQGVKWHDTITGGSSLLSTRSLSNYLSVNYKFIYGKKVDYKKGYLINLNYIQKAVEEYCRVWSKLDDDSCIIHGDFSMDNLIFLDKGVAIIDWEHFSLKGMPKGFDALNLIYEQLYIFLRYKNLNKQIVEHIKLMFNLLYKNECLDRVYWEGPLMVTRSFILNNQFIWGDQIQKLPILKIKTNQVKLLDKELRFIEF